MTSLKIIQRLRRSPLYWGLWYFGNKLAKFMAKILRSIGLNEKFVYAIVKAFHFEYDEKRKCFWGKSCGIKLKLVIDERRAIIIPIVNFGKFPVKDIHYTFPTYESPRIHRTVRFIQQVFVNELIDKLGEETFSRYFGFETKRERLCYRKSLPFLITPHMLVQDLYNLILLVKVSSKELGK